MRQHRVTWIFTVLLATFVVGASGAASAESLDADAIAKAAGTTAMLSDDVVRIGWSRDDVAVTIDGMAFPPPAGLGSWAAFKAIDKGSAAMVMGDTVVFEDEVDAAMDAAFSHGLTITALHNHFFYDEPKVYFMHLGGRGSAPALASAVKAVWDAIKHVRADNPVPARQFEGVAPQPGGAIDPGRIEEITGLDTTTQPGGVIKISTGRTASMHGTELGGSMGLASWAAFSGSDELAAMDGDFIMTADEVQPVLKALRNANLHVVALHNHMTGEEPAYYFTHFWGKGPAARLARGFKTTLDVQESTKEQP